MSEEKNEALPSVKQEIEKISAQLPQRIEAYFETYAAEHPEFEKQITSGEISMDAFAQMAVSKLVIQMGPEAIHSLYEKSQGKIEVKTVYTLEKYIEKTINYMETSSPESPEIATRFLQALGGLEFDKLPQTVTSVMHLGFVPERGFIGTSETLDKENLEPLLQAQREAILPVIEKQMSASFSQEALGKGMDAKGLVKAMIEEVFEMAHGKIVPVSQKEDKFYDELNLAKEVHIDGKKMTPATAQKNLTKIMDDNCNVDNLKKALFDRIKAARTDAPSEDSTVKHKVK